MGWIAKAAVKKKWSSGLQEEALLTDHNGDVPNGYAWWACTPLRQWCDRNPDFSDPDFSNPDFSNPNLGDDN
jgi:hypothetical protein